MNTCRERGKKKMCSETEVAICPFQLQQIDTVPILVGAGGWSSMVDHSKTILCLQKTWNVQSPLLLLLLCVPILMSTMCSFTLRQHTLCNYGNLLRNYPRFIAAGPKSLWGQRKPKLWWDSPIKRLRYEPGPKMAEKFWCSGWKLKPC